MTPLGAKRPPPPRKIKASGLALTNLKREIVDMPAVKLVFNDDDVECVSALDEALLGGAQEDGAGTADIFCNPDEVRDAVEHDVDEAEAEALFMSDSDGAVSSEDGGDESWGA